MIETYRKGRNAALFSIVICGLTYSSGLLAYSKTQPVNEPEQNVATETAPNATTSSTITKQQMLYSYDEMFNFNIKEYLQKNAPQLVPHAEVISHYAGYSSISPKLLIALIEQQSGLVSKQISKQSQSKMARPFGDLSSKYGFKEQVADVSERLAMAFYDGHSFAQTGLNEKHTTSGDAVKALNAVLAPSLGHVSAKRLDQRTQKAVSALNNIYHKLFEQNDSQNSRNFSTESVSTEASIDNYFQLPYPMGRTWTYGGSHTNTGSGSYPQSSLDLNNGGYWGDNLSNLWVVSAAPGRVKVHSSCFVEVYHDNNWSTTYYHVDNIQYNTNTQINRNVAIANYASDKSQALCNGGQSTGPHVHFSLKRNAEYYHLNGMSFSGFEVSTGRDSYDSNCSYFWLEKNGYKYCAWSRITNPGVTDANPPSEGDTYTGYLSHRGYAIEPDGNWFNYAGGTISVDMSGPSNADFDIRLDRWNGNEWRQVAISNKPNSEESISYAANSGYYMLVIYSYSGSGNYSVTIDK